MFSNYALYSENILYNTLLYGMHNTNIHATEYCILLFCAVVIVKISLYCDAV